MQTGRGIHIFACTYVNDFTHARMLRSASAHICTYICVYGTHIYQQIQTERERERETSQPFEQTSISPNQKFAKTKERKMKKD